MANRKAPTQVKYGKIEKYGNNDNIYIKADNCTIAFGACNMHSIRIYIYMLQNKEKSCIEPVICPFFARFKPIQKHVKF